MHEEHTRPVHEVPLDYEEEPLPGGVRFVLPKRQLRKLRMLGWALVLAGLFALAFLGIWMAVPISWGWRLVQQGDWFGWGLCAFGMLGLAGVGKCLKLGLAGIAVLTNQVSSQVEIRGQRLMLHERFFGLRWTRKPKASLANVRELTVESARLPESQVDDKFVAEWIGDFCHAIYAQVNGKKPLIVAPCYPQSLLDRLATDLAGYLPQATVSHPPQNGVSPTPRSAEVPRSIREVLQPAGSPIQMETRPDGTTYRVPAAGFAKGPKGLLGFAIAWNLIVALFAGGLVFAVVDQADPLTAWVLLLLLPFIAVGVGTMLAAINMARRKTAIVTAGDRVMVVSDGIFGKKSRTWDAKQLHAIKVGPSGMAVNNIPVLELQFHAEGGKFGVLSERADEELRWLATDLSAQLGLHVPQEHFVSAVTSNHSSLATATSK